LLDPVDVTPEAGAHLYLDRPVLVQPPNAREDGTAAFASLTDTFDTGLGAHGLQVDRAGRTFRTQDYHWMLIGREEHEAFRRWLYRMKGRWQETWLPSFTSDFILAAPVAAGSAVLPVIDTRFAYWGGPRGDRRHLCIELADGTRLFRAVQSVTSSDDEREYLTLDAPAEVVLSPLSVLRISVMSRARLDQDAVEISHLTDQDGVAECTLTFRAL